MSVGEKVLVLGTGGAGVRIAGALCALPEAAHLTVAAFDTDQTALAQVETLDETMKLLGNEQWLNGMGTGGDVVKGQRAMAHESAWVRGLLEGARLAVVTGGLGGGTATGGAGVIATSLSTTKVL